MVSTLANIGFQRIAQNLEKLPCELHGEILDNLEFSQLIRLSSCAGPRLTWSLQNNLSTWGRRFRGEDRGTWQTLLSITDRVKYLCFKEPATKGDLPEVFKDYDLSFLMYQDSDWRLNTHVGWVRNRIRLREQEGALAIHWLAELSSIVINKTWDTFHEHYSRMVQPILPSLPPQALQLFTKMTALNREGTRPYQHGYHETNPTFSVDELAAFIEIYQQLRLVRGEALAAELHRLANIYEAHPTRLKPPFDPRIRAPDTFNTRHVPTQMRREARKMIRNATNTRWNTMGVKCTRFAYPPLVPYKSQVQSFHDCFEHVAGEQGVDGEQSALVEIMERCQVVVESAPSWARVDTEEEVDAVAHLSDALGRHNLGSHGLTPKVRVHAYSKGRPDCKLVVLPVLPRGDAELEWLERFAEATAWLEGNPSHGSKNAR
jgi:hypothetical protein